LKLRVVDRTPLSWNKLKKRNPINPQQLSKNFRVKDKFLKINNYLKEIARYLNTRPSQRQKRIMLMITRVE
jgi:hypothetical protein